MKNSLSLILFVCCLWSCAEQKDEPTIDTYRIGKQTDYQELIKKYLEVEEDYKSPLNRNIEAELLRLLVLNDTSDFEDLKHRIFMRYYIPAKRDSFILSGIEELPIEEYTTDIDDMVIRLRLEQSFVPYYTFITLIKKGEIVTLKEKRYSLDRRNGCHPLNKELRKECFIIEMDVTEDISLDDFAEITKLIHHSGLEYFKSDIDLKKFSALDCSTASIEIFQKNEYFPDKYHVKRHCSTRDNPLNRVALKILELADSTHYQARVPY